MRVLGMTSFKWFGGRVGAPVFAVVLSHAHVTYGRWCDAEELLATDAAEGIEKGNLQEDAWF